MPVYTCAHTSAREEGEGHLALPTYPHTRLPPSGISPLFTFSVSLFQWWVMLWYMCVVYVCDDSESGV